MFAACEGIYHFSLHILKTKNGEKKLKKVIVMFGAGVTDSGEISSVSKGIINTMESASRAWKFDVALFSGDSKYSKKSESSLLKKYAEESKLPIPVLLESDGKYLWEKSLNVVRTLKQNYPDEMFFLTAIVLHSEMQRVLAMLKDAVAFFEGGYMVTLYPAKEHYDALTSKKKFHSARKLEIHEKFSYFIYTLLSSLFFSKKSFCRTLSAMRIRL